MKSFNRATFKNIIRFSRIFCLFRILSHFHTLFKIMYFHKNKIASISFIDRLGIRSVLKHINLQQIGLNYDKAPNHKSLWKRRRPDDKNTQPFFVPPFSRVRKNLQNIIFSGRPFPFDTITKWSVFVFTKTLSRHGALLPC